MALVIENSELKPGVVVIRLAGKLMLGPEGQRVETLVAELLGQGQKNFIFELSGLTHIDSTGIGRFISSFNKVRQAGGIMRMAGATGQVREGFRVTRLDTVFKFLPDVETASQGLA